MIFKIIDFSKRFLKEIIYVYVIFPFLSLLTLYFSINVTKFIKILFWAYLPIFVFLFLYFYVVKKINIDKKGLPIDLLFGVANIILIFFIYPISTYYLFNEKTILSFILGLLQIIILLIAIFIQFILNDLEKRKVKFYGMKARKDYLALFKRCWNNVSRRNKK